jgi:hypothetical protein
MAKNKQNPFLEAFAAKLEANYQHRLDVNNELDTIAFMVTIHEELGVGPGRAGRLFNAFRANKVNLAKTIREDYGDEDNGDKEILHTKKKYAQYLRTVFSPEDWERVKIWFPMLRDYWGGESHG